MKSELSLDLLEDSLPTQAQDALPEGVFKRDGTRELSKLFSFSYFVQLALSSLDCALESSGLSLAVLCGLVIATSVMHMLARSLGDGGVSSTFSTVGSLCVCVYAFGALKLLFTSVSSYLSTLSSFGTAVVPFISLAYAAGGNVNAAAVGSTGMLVSITLVEGFVAHVLTPLVGMCAVLGVVSTVSPSLRVGTLSSFVRGILTLLISLAVAAISAIMSFQSTLASASDTLGSRAVRFAASSFIPIVGSAVGDAVRTVSVGIAYLRSAAGGIAVAVLAAITLPVFFELMLTRITLALCASLADMLGCTSECATLKNVGSTVNFLLALVALMDMLFSYSFILLAHCAAAYG